MYKVFNVETKIEWRFSFYYQVMEEAWGIRTGIKTNLAEKSRCFVKPVSWATTKSVKDALE